jgi:HSP20 family molecular chaperone IbpA
VFDVQSFWRGEIGWGKAPAVDIVDTEKAYEITTELPGMDVGSGEAVEIARSRGQSRT